ncbi:MAG TPA: hypothetical protein DFS52_01845 [Myxococcales bacterium]|jgi:uncharacterized membrane protein YbhN (UPF0104 family)|nr:hypothetical protein [Myxococcales bacterium]
MNGLLRRLLLAMLFGIAIYGAFVAYTGFRDVQESLAGFRWSALGLALLLATANYGLRVVKWEYYLARLGIRNVPKLDSALVFLSGFVLTMTPGKVGEMFKSAVLAQTYGVPAARTAPIVIAERLTDVIGVVLLIVLGSVGFAGGLGWAMAGGALVAVGVALILWQRPLLWLVSLVERGPARLRPLAPKLLEALDALRVLAGPGALLWPALLSFVAWGCEGLALHVVVQGFGLEGDVALAVFFYATATLAGAIIPVPGGLGVTESMIQQQLVRLGAIPLGPATTSMILVRLATLWWAVLLGFVALGALKLRHPTLFASRRVEGEAGGDVPAAPR